MKRNIGRGSGRVLQDARLVDIRGGSAEHPLELVAAIVAWRTSWLLAFAVGVWLSAASFSVSAVAAEPMREFLDGLRQRQYFDWALLYLEQLQDKPDLPAELRVLIPYERAMTLSESARHSVSPETQQRQLDQALGFLEQFTRESPQHPLAATANSTRAGILLNKARVDVLQAKLPSNKDNREEFQNRGREQINAARTIFEKAHDQYKAAWEAFPKFIDKLAEPAKFEARQKAEVAYMRAQLDLALCQFEESQTFDADSSNRKFHLEKAVEMFRDIFTKYRATVGGLHAQMWEAKCYEEMNDPQRALGIYAELLGHPPEGLKTLQDQVRHFRLICLNHDQRREYPLAISEATDWLDKAKPIDQRSPAGQGIRWELVVALEKQADSSASSPSEKDKLLRLAVTHLKTLTRWPGAYRDLAQQRVRDVSLRQKGDDGTGDPKDFDTALALGRDLVKRVGEKEALLKAAQRDKRPRDEVEKLRTDFQQLVKEQIRVLRLALSFADRGTPAADVNQARHLLSYGYYLADRPYEAAIMAEAVAYGPTKDKQDEQLALDAAYLGVAAYIKGFNQTPNEVKVLREVDTRLMSRLANFITGKWPSHTKSNETRMLVGRTFSQLEQPLTASEWFLKVPETAENFPEAQCAAGQALWQQYLMSSLTEDVTQRPTPEALAKWRADAEKFLTLGVERTQKKLPEQGKTPDELVAAKVALAEILLSSGQDQPAIDLLTKLPHSVLVAIHVDDQTRRPPHPSVRSSRFASHVYQLLLRGRVGLQQLDAAREVMTQLEQLADHSGGADAVTAVYVQLGRELEKELNRLKGAGDSRRFSEVRTSFESFLDSMFKRGDQNLSSLTWIAETYYGLAQSSLDNADESKTYFDRAASTYQTILERAQKEKQFAADDRLAGVRLRLANCRRRQGEYKEAESLLKTLIADRPRVPEVQFEAVYVWHDQGLTGKTEFLQKAISGGKVGDKAVVWGWTDLSNRLQRLIADGRSETKDRYGEKLYEAWYNTALCRHKLGLVQQTTAKKQAELEVAKQVISTFVRLTTDIPNEWWGKFDRLYRQIQTDLGQSPTPLERPKEILVASPAPKSRSTDESSTAAGSTSASSKAEAGTAKKSADDKKAHQDSSLSTVIFVVMVLGGCGAIGWMIFANKSRRRSSRIRVGAESLSLHPDTDMEITSAPVVEMPEFAAPRKSTTKTAGAAARASKGKKPS